MNTLNAWSTAVCMAALGCAAVRQLAPKTGSGKLFRLLTASFFFCSLLVPLFRLYTTPSLEWERLPTAVVEDALEERVLAQLDAQVKEAVEGVVTEVLSQRGIVPRKIEVTTDISEDGNICIQQVAVHLDKQHAAIASTMQGVLERELGAPVQLHIGE